MITVIIKREITVINLNFFNLRNLLFLISVIVVRNLCNQE